MEDRDKMLKLARIMINEGNKRLKRILIKMDKNTKEIVKRV